MYIYIPYTTNNHIEILNLISLTLKGDLKYTKSVKTIFNFGMTIS